MLEFLKNLFSENSQVSSMRVMCMLTLMVALVVVVYGIFSSHDTILVSTMLLGYAFGGKIVQKIKE